jgi:small-conductance mechanosensitive channel
MFRGGRTWIAVSLFVPALCVYARAQEGGLPVLIDGQEVARVYAPLGLFQPEHRAPAIQERILALARIRAAVRVATRQIPSEKATAVVAGPILLMTVTELDAEAAGVTHEQLAKQYAANIQQALEIYRVRHTWRSLVLAILKTGMAWSGYLLLVWVLWMGVEAIRSRLEQRFRRRAQELAPGLNRLLYERGRPMAMGIIRAAAVLALLSGFSFVLSYTFGLYPQTAHISTTLWDYIGSIFRAIGKGIWGYLPSGGFAAAAICVAYYVLRLLKFLTRAVETGDLTLKGIHPEMARPTYQLVRLLVVLIALVVVFPYLPGGNSDAFKGISIFVGDLLSFGSSSAVSNVLAGVVLTYMRPYRRGDRVKIAETLGDVVEKSLLVSRVRTIKNVEVVIPNSAILSSQILNYSALAASDGLILNTSVTIGYDAPWRTVHNLLRQAALATDGILAEPAPFVLQTSLNDYHVSYELNAYTALANETQNIYSRLHERIQDSFNQAGIEIMSPAYHSLRDGNTVTIPEADRPAEYAPPTFVVSTRENGSGAATQAHDSVLWK